MNWIFSVDHYMLCLQEMVIRLHQFMVFPFRLFKFLCHLVSLLGQLPPTPSHFLFPSSFPVITMLSNFCFPKTFQRICSVVFFRHVLYYFSLPYGFSEGLFICFSGSPWYMIYFILKVKFLLLSDSIKLLCLQVYGFCIDISHDDNYCWMRAWLCWVVRVKYSYLSSSTPALTLLGCAS